MAGKPIHVFVSCGNIIQGSYFEVLFHQLMDGAVPKLAMDRKMVIDQEPVRVSLTTDSGLAHYPARLNDLYRQADVIVLVYSVVDRAEFETLGERYDYISGPVRDFAPATFILLGIVPPGGSGKPHLISPQELESLRLQISASTYELDASVEHKQLEELWAFMVRACRASRAPSLSSTSSNQPPMKESTMTQILSRVITGKEVDQQLVAAMASVPAKKTEKAFKAAQKLSGKRELLVTATPRFDVLGATLLTPVLIEVTLTNTSKAPVNWAVMEPFDRITSHYFFSVSSPNSQQAIPKGKSSTFTICCTFFQPAEISRFILIECPQEPDWCLPIFVNLAAPLQLRDPLSFWNIDRKAISIGFRTASSMSAQLYRSTLYGAVVTFKDWVASPHLPDAFHVEWDAFVRLKHPNIALFLGGSKDPNQAFMVLEYLKHGQLGTFLQNPPPRGVVRTIDLRLKMATDLAKAMAFLHSQKMLHRDLTSAHVLVDADCSVKLGNFGEPKEIVAGVGIVGDSGNLDWTAPELLTPLGQFTQQTDVFSFGVILWELGAERAPARTMMDIKKGGLSGLPMDIKSRYPAFVELLSQCTHFDPEQRPSFDEIVERLEKIRSSGPTTYTPPSMVTKARPEPPRYIPPVQAPAGAPPRPTDPALAANHGNTASAPTNKAAPRVSQAPQSLVTITDLHPTDAGDLTKTQNKDQHQIPALPEINGQTQADLSKSPPISPRPAGSPRARIFPSISPPASESVPRPPNRLSSQSVSLPKTAPPPVPRPGGGATKMPPASFKMPPASFKMPPTGPKSGAPSPSKQPLPPQPPGRSYTVSGRGQGPLKRAPTAPLVLPKAAPPPPLALSNSTSTATFQPISAISPRSPSESAPLSSSPASPTQRNLPPSPVNTPKVNAKFDNILDWAQDVFEDPGQS